jgi:hypothetical protein
MRETFQQPTAKETRAARQKNPLPAQWFPKTLSVSQDMIEVSGQRRGGWHGSLGADLCGRIQEWINDVSARISKSIFITSDHCQVMNERGRGKQGVDYRYWLS